MKLRNAYHRLNRRQKQILFVTACLVCLNILTQALFHSVRALELDAGPFIGALSVSVTCLIVAGRNTNGESDKRRSDQPSRRE
jgi:hypothetical protein